MDRAAAVRSEEDTAFEKTVCRVGDCEGTTTGVRECYGFGFDGEEREGGECGCWVRLDCCVLNATSLICLVLWFYRVHVRVKVLL